MVLDRALIKKSEESAVESGAFSFRELMYRAGCAAVDTVTQRYGCQGKKIAVMCGNGNNGGDGFVAAGKFYENGADVTLILPLGAPKTEDAVYFFEKLNNIKITDELTDSYDIIVDAVFGIGLNRKMSDEVNLLLGKANRLNAKRIAIDVPSGVETDSGKIFGTVFDADLTVTFIALKPCLLLPPASDYCGETVVADIGVKPAARKYSVIKPPVFPKRRRNSHKGTYGTALLFCGSYGMAGAAVLSCKAALRSGTGIAKCVVCDSIYPAFTGSVPEAVCIPVKQDVNGMFDPDVIDLDAVFKKAAAILFGCGVGKSSNTLRLLELIISLSKVPIVLDADGINLLASNIDILKKSKASIIVTPHPAEMGRLCGKTAEEIEADRVSAAAEFAVKYGCTVVLKGGNTIVASKDGEISFNILGNPGMAKGGCGDVLSGVIVSLLAQGFTVSQAAEGGVYLHSLAGDKAALKKGQRAVLPSDIIDEL